MGDLPSTPRCARAVTAVRSKIDAHGVHESELLRAVPQGLHCEKSFLRIVARHPNHAVGVLKGCTAGVVTVPQSGTNFSFFFWSLGLSCGQVPLVVTLKSSILDTDCLSKHSCMNLSSPQGPYC